MGEAAETEAAVSAAVDRVEADIADSVLKTLKKNPATGGKTQSRSQGGMERSRRIRVRRRGCDRKQHGRPRERCSEKKKEDVPTGCQPFARHLKRLNVPNDVVGNPDRWQYMQLQ